jgi:hypothetical protein
MLLRHGNFEIDAPADWTDESKIVMAEPPDDTIAKEMAKRAAASGAPIQPGQGMLAKPRRNFVLSTRPYPLDIPPREFCDKELRAMLAAIPNAKVGEFAWVKCGDTEAASQDLEFELEGSTLKQLHALAILEKQLVHFVGTSTPGAFAKARELFLNVLASFRVHR